MQASHPKTSAVYENPEVRKGKSLVLTMRGISKTVGFKMIFIVNHLGTKGVVRDVK
jgi:hypothetical protein